MSLWHHQEIATLQKKTVGHQSVEVRMPTDVISKRLDSYDNSWHACLFTKDELEKFRQTFCSAVAELAQ